MEKQSDDLFILFLSLVLTAFLSIAVKSICDMGSDI